MLFVFVVVDLIAGSLLVVRNCVMFCCFLLFTSVTGLNFAGSSRVVVLLLSFCASKLPILNNTSFIIDVTILVFSISSCSLCCSCFSLKLFIFWFRVLFSQFFLFWLVLQQFSIPSCSPILLLLLSDILLSSGRLSILLLVDLVFWSCSPSS